MKKKKKIQYLVELSLTSGRLDASKIAAITKMLEKDKKELTYYYKALLRKREEETVTVIAAIDVPKSIALGFKKVFIDKDIAFLKDPKILAGLKVCFSDFVFDASFKTYFEKVRDAYEID